MSDIFTRRFHVRWGDMDFNGHMRNTAYLDTAGDVRMMYFEANGFSIAEFTRVQFGPVIFRDELEYFRELRLLDQIDVTLILAGMSEDGSRFRLRNEFFTAKGTLAARVTSSGGWLSFASRTLTTPPEALVRVIESIHKADDFSILKKPERLPVM